MHRYGHFAWDFPLEEHPVERVISWHINLLLHLLRGIRLRTESPVTTIVSSGRRVYTHESVCAVGNPITSRHVNYTLRVVGRVEACTRDARWALRDGERGDLNVSTLGREWPRIIGSNLVICKLGETGFARFFPPLFKSASGIVVKSYRESRFNLIVRPILIPNNPIDSF